MTLSVEQQILVEQRVSNNAKSTFVAYLLWFFFCAFGGHRFYLGQTETGAAMLVLFVFGVATVLLYGIGAIFLLVLLIWTFVDLFLIPGMIRKDKDKLRQQYSMELMAGN